MDKKSDILSKLAALKEFSTANGDGMGHAALFADLEAAIETYFVADNELQKKTMYTVHQLAMDIMTRRTIYERQELLAPMPSNYPGGYNDIRESFTSGGAFTEIKTCIEAEFLAAFIYEVTAPGELKIAKSNLFLDKWTAAVSRARASEKAALQAVSDFCEVGSFNAGLQVLFETLGGIVESINKDDLAKEIYDTRGYKELINIFGMDIHIPTVLGGK